MTKEKAKKKPGRRPGKKLFIAPAQEVLTAVVVREMKPQAQVREALTEAKIIEAFDAMGITTKLGPQQKKLFIAVAREFNLNPLRREIHAVKMGADDDEGGGGTLVPVVGYEVYIDRAEETGRLEYWFIEESGEIDPADWRKSTYCATVIIKRRDWPKEFRWIVRYVEAVGLRWDKAKSCHQPNSMWRKRGHFMTQKCTIGQGFRLVFREILRGMPYIDAEIENAEAGDNHIEEDKGPLKEPRAFAAPAAALAPAQEEKEPPVQFPSAPKGPYAEIMTTLREKTQSKEGPMIALFDNHENMEWKLKADESRKSPEELQGVQQELEAIAARRRERIKGGA